jgi:hypothetical protein
MPVAVRAITCSYVNTLFAPCRTAGSRNYAPVRVQRARRTTVAPQAAMKALVFDCDGVCGP